MAESKKLLANVAVPDGSLIDVVGKKAATTQAIFEAFYAYVIKHKLIDKSPAGKIHLDRRLRRLSANHGDLFPYQVGELLIPHISYPGAKDVVTAFSLTGNWQCVAGCNPHPAGYCYFWQPNGHLGLGGLNTVRNEVLSETTGYFYNAYDFQVAAVPGKWSVARGYVSDSGNRIDWNVNGSVWTRVTHDPD